MNEIKKQEAGFSYIDVMIAMAILMVGVMALVGAITNGINMTTRGSLALAAKQVSTSTMESVFTARDLPPVDLVTCPTCIGLGWAAIGNVGDVDVPLGVFLVGKQPIYPTSGKDGIIGTADDSWGADGISGTADDAAANTPAIGMQREILIRKRIDADRPTAPISMRQVDVIIYYQTGALERREVFSSLIASYRDSDTGT